jgi:hypothetical protein
MWHRLEMKKLNKIITFSSLLISTNIWAINLSQLEITRDQSQATNELNSLSPSIIKNIEASWNESRLSDDSYKVKLNFDNILKYGNRKEGFTQAKNIYNLFLEFNKKEEMLSTFNKIITYHFDQRALTIKQAYLEKLTKSLKSIKKIETSLIHYVTLEEDLKLLENSIAELTSGLKTLEEDFNSTYQASIASFPIKNLLTLDQIQSYLQSKKSFIDKTLTTRILEEQVKINKLEKDISFDSEDAILTSLEYERKVRDEYIEPNKRLDEKNTKTDHSISIGITLPFFGDDTAKMMKLSNYTEKNFKLSREIRSHQLEFKSIYDLTLNRINLFKNKKGREAKTINKIKEQALNKLAFNEYSQALKFEFEHEIENQEILKEVYLNYLFMTKEYGDLTTQSLSPKQ